MSGLVEAPGADPLDVHDEPALDVGAEFGAMGAGDAGVFAPLPADVEVDFAGSGGGFVG